MHRYTETRILPYTPEQMFSLVVDIEKYPAFLPWCRGARVVSREADGAFLGELVISFSHLTERYTSRIVAIAPSHGFPSPHRAGSQRSSESFDGGGTNSNSTLFGSPPPNLPPMGGGTNGEGRIDVTLVSGPFKHLTNHWRFVPHGHGCEIHLDLAFEFKSKLLDTLLGGIFGKACDKMVGAFTARADALYGRL